MSADQLIAALAAELQIPDLALNPQGVCQLSVEGKLLVNIEEAKLEARLHLYSEIAMVPAVERETFYATLLSAQLFGQEIGDGCSFGLDESSGSILLCRSISSASVEEESFIAAVEEFMNWAEHWQQKLGGQVDDEEYAPDEEIPDASFIRA